MKNVSDAILEFSCIFLVLNTNSTRMTVLSVCTVFAQNKLASYWSGQQALASQWLDLFANCTPACLNQHQEPILLSSAWLRQGAAWLSVLVSGLLYGSPPGSNPARHPSLGSAHENPGADGNFSDYSHHSSRDLQAQKQASQPLTKDEY